MIVHSRISCLARRALSLIGSLAILGWLANPIGVYYPNIQALQGSSKISTAVLGCPNLLTGSNKFPDVSTNYMSTFFIFQIFTIFPQQFRRFFIGFNSRGKSNRCSLAHYANVGQSRQAAYSGWSAFNFIFMCSRFLSMYSF